MTNSNSTMDSSAPNPNDNLPARQKMIMERLTGIRSNKQRILETLRDMKEKLGEDEEPDKEMMGKMIASYDLLTGQEEEYMRIMQMIVTIRANAADDVRHEVEEENKAANNKKNDGDTAETEAKSDPKTAGPEATNTVKEDMEGQTTDTTNAPTGEVKEKRNGGTEEEWEEVEEELGMLGEVAGEAVAASVLNDRLVETLQLHRDKRAALEQIRQKQRESQRSSANEALKQVELTRLKVASEQDEVERKRKTLERLRREAVRRGIKLEPGTASEPDIVVEAQPEPKSVTEAKLRAKLEAKKKQHEQAETEDNSPPIPDNLVPSERIPPIEEVGGGVPPESTNDSSGSSKKKKKGKRAREQTRERRDAINASIREKLASIEARKQRMREIQSQLVKPVASQPDMNETFLKAQERLKSLTAMREHLEELQESGETLPEETAALLEEQLVEDESETVRDDNGVTQANVTDGLGPALDHIEQRGPSSESDRQTCAILLRQSLLVAKPQVLVQLAEAIVKLANGEVVSDLSTTVDLVLSALDESYSNQSSTDKETHDSSETRGEDRLESGTKSPELSLSDTCAPQQPSANSDTDNGNGQSLKEQRIERAKRRLSTSKAKLQKQRTLERIRCITGDEAGEENKQPQGLESDICRIVEGVVPWIRDHADEEGDELLMHELRDVILKHASAVCYPDGSASDLFDKQLSTIVDDTLSQYYGNKLGADREQLVFDISEVLYNELAFFQLMHDIDNMADIP